MDNVWERLVQLQARQMGDISNLRKFKLHINSNLNSSDPGVGDLNAEDTDRNESSLSMVVRKNQACFRQPSVLDRRGSDEEQEHILDEEIWRNLPAYLIESILFPHLPLHSLLRFRSVCKRWNALLHDYCFLQSWRNLGPLDEGLPSSKESPWLVFRGSTRECVAYNPSLDRWSNIPLSFLPSQRVRVVASAGGLLCMRKRDDSLTVLNPFTKVYIHLTPKHSRWKYPLIGMVAGTSSSSYKVIVTGSNGVTEVYNSTTRSWKLVERRPLRHRFQTNVVYSNGFLYSAGFSMIMVYDVARESWSEMKGPPVTQHTHLIMPQISECKGSLIMVEVVSERFIMRSVSIWAKDCSRRRSNSKNIGIEKGEEEEEDRHSREWVKIVSMPENLLDEVVEISKNRFFSYFGYDDLLCFVIARREILTYTISRKSWRWLPSCPFVLGFAHRFAAFGFCPALEAAL